MILIPNVLLVDTDICIDVSRGYAPTITRLEQAEQAFTITISDITHMELLIGCANKRQQAEVAKFLRRFEFVPLDTVVSAGAIELLRRYRLSHGLLLADALIA